MKPVEKAVVTDQGLSSIKFAEHCCILYCVTVPYSLENTKRYKKVMYCVDMGYLNSDMDLRTLT